MSASPAIRAALVGHGYVRVRPAIVIRCCDPACDRIPTRPVAPQTLAESALEWTSELRGRP